MVIIWLTNSPGCCRGWVVIHVVQYPSRSDEILFILWMFSFDSDTMLELYSLDFYPIRLSLFSARYLLNFRNSSLRPGMKFSMIDIIYQHPAQ